MRRRGLWMAIALVLVLVIGSCQGDRMRRELTEPVTLKLSGWGASPTEQRLLQQVLHRFEETHPSIRVRFETIADQYMDVIKTRLIGDAGPDVFYLDALEAPFLMQSGVLEPLEPYITESFDLKDVDPNLLAAFQGQGHIFGLPKDYSTLALFYNRRAFAEAGLSQPPTTWEELRDSAARLTRDRNQDGRLDQYGFGIVPELARLTFMVAATGGQVVNEEGWATFATPEAIQGLQLTVEQYQRDRTAARPPDVGTHSTTEMLGQGKAAMVLEGNWAIPFLQETFPELDFATAEVPRIQGQPGTMVYTVAYVMNHRCRYKREAWELIAYLTGKDGMKQWTGTGFALPTRHSVAAALGYDRDTLRSPLVAGAAYATPWQIGPFPGAVMNNFNNQFLSTLLAEQPLDQALQRAQIAANRQIEFAQPFNPIP